MNKKAVALFSGGLDSILAIKLMLEQAIEVHALNFLSVFCDSKSNNRKDGIIKSAKNLKVPIEIMDITKEFMEIVKAPRYGRGSSMNPCIDCRIFGFKKAKIFMEKIGASFIVTGEVLGERPMSQTRHAIDLIERKSGMPGLILRPLSGRLFEPSMPEKMGIVDRARLLDIQGRSRNRQFGLAKEFGIDDYPTPAGGCLLTDKGFSNRLKDLFKYNAGYEINDLNLLKIGRQFRLNESVKLFVGRDEEENKLLLKLLRPGDYVFDVVDIPSPIGLARGDLNEQDIALISSIIARYSDAKSDIVKLCYRLMPSENTEIVTVQSATEKLLSSLRI